jgi:hypothetical protein
MDRAATSRNERRDIGGRLVKSYLAITAVLFGLLVVAHVWRLITESSSLATDPWFVLTTLTAAFFSLWGTRLYFSYARRLPGQP